MVDDNPTINKHGTVDVQLCHDFEILQRLLQRNYAQQHRALYFKRLQMVVKCLERYDLISSREDKVRNNGSDAGGVTCALMDSLNEAERLVRHYQVYAADLRREDDKWRIASNSKVERGKSTSGTAFDGRLLRAMHRLYNILTRYLPECFSRIDYAASAFFETMSRGYFLTFCTVATSALARIRTILMQCGQEILSKYQVFFDEIRQAANEKDFRKLRVWGSSEECLYFLSNFHVNFDMMNTFVYEWKRIKDDEENNGEDYGKSALDMNLKCDVQSCTNVDDVGTSVGLVPINAIPYLHGDRDKHLKETLEMETTHSLSQLELVPNAITKLNRTVLKCDVEVEDMQVGVATHANTLRKRKEDVGRSSSKDEIRKKKKKKPKKRKSDYFDDIFG